MRLKYTGFDANNNKWWYSWRLNDAPNGVACRSAEALLGRSECAPFNPRSRPIAQRLPENPTRRIAIVIEMDFALPWHQDCYQGIMRYGQEHGWRCVLDLTAAGMHGDPTRTDYDGVVGRIPSEVAERVAGLGLPMVHLTKYVTKGEIDRFADQYGVFVDPLADTRMAVEHLVHNGYPRVGLVAEGDTWFEAVVEEVRSACADHGVGCVESFKGPIDVPASHEEQVRIIRDMMGYLAALEKPVGLVMDPDFYALHAAHICTELGIRIPDEVGIVTLPAPLTSLTAAWPTISSVAFDFFKQGYEAAAMLDRLMAGERVDPRHMYLQPLEVTVRDSTDVFLCEDEIVSEAMRWIAAHVQNEITISDVAEKVGVSRATLYRRFREVMGKSPQDEITRLRIDYVKRLLKETSLSITEISKRCGFSASSHLARYFKREIGMTPSAYRAARAAQPDK